MPSDHSSGTSLDRLFGSLFGSLFDTVAPVGSKVLLESSATEPNWQQIFGYTPIAVQSGTAALALALCRAQRQVTEAAALSNKDAVDGAARNEVLLPAYACPDLVSACIYAGLTPVLVDIAQDRAAYCFASLQRAISERTVAIVAVNFLGLADDLEPLASLCHQHGALLIEDNAQAFPRPGQPLYGDFVISSFGRGKSISLLGGGLLLEKGVTAQSEIKAQSGITAQSEIKAQSGVAAQSGARAEGGAKAQREISADNNVFPNMYATDDGVLGRLKTQLKLRAYNWLISPRCYGLIASLPMLNLGATELHLLDAIQPMPLLQRGLIEANWQRYCLANNTNQQLLSELLADSGGCYRGEAFIDLAAVHRDSQTTPLLRYPLLMSSRASRDALLEDLAQHGLSATAMYQRPLCEIAGVSEYLAAAQRGTSAVDFPNAAHFAERLITLPVHALMQPRHFARLREVFNAAA